MTGLAAALAAGLLSGTGASAPPKPAEERCWSEGEPGRPSADLYCIDLVPRHEVPGATGTVELGWVPTPFGIAVTADGVHLHELIVRVAGLPPPETLGPYTTYIAWATTPLLRPMVRLGEVAPGRPARGEVAFNQFMVLVSAEASADVEERTGQLVLRGLSPSMRLLPEDLPFIIAGLGDPADPDHAHHDQHAAHADSAADRADRQRAADHQHDRPVRQAGAPIEWVVPPMHPAVEMPPSLMALRPNVTPFLPGMPGDDDAAAVPDLPGDAATATIPDARPRELLRLRDGDTIDLVAQPVRRTILGRTHIMYGFNGQYPGPLIHVDEDATIVVDFENRTALPSAVHWHGLRLDNRFDGVPHVTQEPVPPGGRFRYEVRFPDAGIYWYHPHHREDIKQDMGLYGNMFVESPRPDYFGPANREEFLMLDDLLVGGTGLVPYGLESPTHALMGRFGNVLLVNGEPERTMEVDRGDVVRFFLTNAANTRTFNLHFEGARVKVVGSDIGLFEREEWVESVVLAPAERYIVEARFDAAGDVAITNRVQALNKMDAAFFPEVDTLIRVRVSDRPASPDHGFAFERLRENPEVTAEMEAYRAHFDRPPDLELVLAQEVRVDELPFPLGPLMLMDSAYFQPVEWSDLMPEMNWVVTGRQVRWILRDPATGRENMDIDWRFRLGDVVKVRLVNDRNAFHAMQHPLHIHGQRFMILSRNGVPERNRVWKDTILLPVGSSVDILLELSNPGRWMTHCHIAEHLEAGMMMVFEVDEDGESR